MTFGADLPRTPRSWFICVREDRTLNTQLQDLCPRCWFRRDASASDWDTFFDTGPGHCMSCPKYQGFLEEFVKDCHCGKLYHSDSRKCVFGGQITSVTCNLSENSAGWLHLLMATLVVDARSVK